MNPELAKRLRRFGDTVDQAAVSAGAPAPPLRDTQSPVRADPLAELDDHDDLEPVVSITGWRHRHYRKFVAAAAALVIVVAGALLTTRITGSPESGTAASTDVPGLVDDSTESAATSEPKATVSPTSTTTAAAVPATSAPVLLSGSSTPATTSSSTSTPTTARPQPPAVCPNGYGPNDRLPLRLCNEGAAVKFIQGRLSVHADGFFGRTTEQAVRDFQALNGLAVDGLVGPDTWTALGGSDIDGDRVVDPEDLT